MLKQREKYVMFYKSTSSAHLLFVNWNCTPTYRSALEAGNADRALCDSLKNVNFCSILDPKMIKKYIG